MHTSSKNGMFDFRRKYVTKGMKVLDVGSTSDSFKNYHSIFQDCIYATLDFENNMPDIVIEGYDWSIEDETYDIVISGQCLEHDKFFWLTLQNISRVLKKGGYICIIVPSFFGEIHRFPIDCYRFLPDSLEVFAEIMGVELIETHHNPEQPNQITEKGKMLGIQNYWGDLRGVFHKK